MKAKIFILVSVIIFISCEAIKRGIHEHEIFYYDTKYAVIDSVFYKNRFDDRYYYSSIPGRVYCFDYAKDAFTCGDTIRLTFTIKERTHIILQKNKQTNK